MQTTARQCAYSLHQAIDAGGNRRARPARRIRQSVHCAVVSLSPLLAALALLASAPAMSQDAGHTAESPWRVGVALGYGSRSNPLIQSDDIPIVVDIDIAWFGERWFFDNGDGGFTLVNNDALSASLVGRFNSDRVFFGKTDTDLVRVSLTGTALAEPVQLTIPDRDYAVELGVELLTDGPWGRLQLTAHHDVSAKHRGYEVLADFAHGWRRQRLYIEPSAGIAYKSAKLNDYYWGIRPTEANAALPVYTAGAGLNLHARLVVSYQVTRNWSAIAVAEFERLSDAAANSPIVEDRSVAALFAGFAYRF